MKIYLAGHRGMVGGAILRQLQARQVSDEALDLVAHTHAELTLLISQQSVRFCKLSDPTRSSLQRQRWAAFMPTTPIRQTSSTRT